MTRDVGLAAILVLSSSALLTAWIRKLAVSHGVLDVPNARSSHTTPTPRGGGAAIVVTTMLALGMLTLRSIVPFELFVTLTGGGLAVAIVGFLDDRHQLSARVRLAVHFGAAIWAMVWLGGLPLLHVGEHTVRLGWMGYVLGVLAIVWALNLFNFMDGIDGLAASEATFIAWAAALLAVSGPMTAISAISLVFGAACAGFLLWNWPPARIFMGDVGSGYLGYFIAVLAIAAGRESSVALLVWLILGGVFCVDATVTLTRRIARGERVYEAHRSHAYQWLARRWRSHQRVTVLVLLVNVAWLLPWACLALVVPSLAIWMFAAALGPLVIAALIAGAGRAEKASP